MVQPHALHSHAGRAMTPLMMLLLRLPQSKLEQAQLGMEQRNFLIASHAKAENRLVDITHALRGQLGTAAAELAALFAKVLRMLCA